jgi:hypothetical protein
MTLRRIQTCLFRSVLRARTKRSIAYRVPKPAPGVWPVLSIFPSR